MTKSLQGVIIIYLEVIWIIIVGVSLQGVIIIYLGVMGIIIVGVTMHFEWSYYTIIWIRVTNELFVQMRI